MFSLLKNGIILRKYLRFLYLFFIIGFLYYFCIGIIKVLFKEKNDALIAEAEPLNESLWNERKIVDESKIKRFQIYFKNLNVNYYFHKEEGFQCNEKKLLIIIPSKPNSYNIRMAIRNTWLKNTSSNVIYLFIIGSTWNHSIRELNKNESYEFGDLIITNIRDTYRNITLKTYAMFQWQQYYCPKVEYLLKADEDTVVDISRLQYWIEKEYKGISKVLNEKVIFGKIWSNVIPKRNLQSKWYVSYKSWNAKYFPDYCNGPQYLLTSNAVEQILKEASKHEIILIEDVFYTGIIAESAGIKRIEKSKNFGFEDSINSLCDENGIPYLTCINEIKLIDKTEKEINDTFAVATNKLSNLSCSYLGYLLKIIW